MNAHPDIAWLQLARNPLRFCASAAAVAFAVMLMFMEFGFQSALFDSACLLHSSLNADLYIISSRTNSLFSMQEFSRRRIFQAQEYPGVTAGAGVYIGQGTCRLLGQNSGRRTLVIGVSPEQKPFRNEATNNELTKLTRIDSCLFDRKSRKEFGPVTARYSAGTPTKLNINRRTVSVVGLFSQGTSFGADGNIIVSEKSFCHLFPGRTSALVDIGLLTVDGGCDKMQLRARLQQSLPEVSVLTASEFEEFEKSYWRETTAIGFIFSTGVVLSLVVGAAVVYQILYSQINEHLMQFATMKAIGYSTGFLVDIVIKQAVLLAIFGFAPGTALSSLLYVYTRDFTGLPLGSDPVRTTTIGSLTVLMCVSSAVVASRRVAQADPAEIF